jgi:hypothetical protein
MPTLVTPSAALGFAVPNSGSFVISPDTTAIEVSGISNAANNFDTTSTPLKLIKDTYYNLYTRSEDNHLYGLFFYEEDTPGSSNDGGGRHWTLWKHHPSTGVVRLAISSHLGSYWENPNAGASIPTTGWTLLNGTVGTLLLKQINIYLSSLPSPTAGGVLPSSISDLKIWLKSDAGVTTFSQSGNTYLTSWADQSGSGQLMRPSDLYLGDGLIQVYPNRVNGKPAIAVNSFRTCLILEPITDLVLGPNTTTLCVHKNISNYGFVYSMGHRQIRGSNPVWRFEKIGLSTGNAKHETTLFLSDRYAGDYVANLFTYMNYEQQFDQFRLLTKITRVAPLSTHQVIRNGKSESIFPSTSTVSNTSAYLAFGSSPYYSEWSVTGEYGTTTVRSEIAEFIHFNRALTDQELANVTEGLRIKYALY